jgi:hypothetical protein
MSLLGKRQLGVSSPYQPQPQRHPPTHLVSQDIEDLEILIRSIADELERAEQEKTRMAAGGKDPWSSGSEGTRSPDLLATPVSAITSPMIGIDTPPPHGQIDSPTSSISSSRGTRDKPVQHSKSRPKERSQGTSSSTSKPAPAPQAGDEKRRREKATAKSKTKTPTETKDSSTRMRSRREGSDGSKGEKESTKRTEMQTLLRVALLCK